MGAPSCAAPTHLLLGAPLELMSTSDTALQENSEKERRDIQIERSHCYRGGVDFIEIGGVQFPASQKSLQGREDLSYCPRECRVSSFKLLQFKFGGV